MTTDRFAADKTTLHAVLEERARAGETITYDEAAALVNRIARGLGPILNAIKADEEKNGWSDLSCLVVCSATRFPSYVGSGRSERNEALALRTKVFTEHTTKGPSRRALLR